MRTASSSSRPISYRDARTQSLPRRGRPDRRASALRAHRAAAARVQHDLPARGARSARSSHAPRTSLMLPELVVAPPHRRGRRRDHERREHRAARPRRPATGPRELCDAIALARRAARPTSSRPGRRWARGVACPFTSSAGHDTASAVLGGGRPDEAFVSAGTWLLVGREQARPDTSAGGAGRRVHQRAGRAGRHPIPPERRGLVAGRGVPPRVGRRPRPAPRRGGGRARPRRARRRDRRAVPRPGRHGRTSCAPPRDSRPDASRATIVRVAVESMAAATASVIAALPVDDTTTPLRGVRVFGGGSRSRALSRRAPTAHRPAGVRSARSRRRPSATRSRRASRWECSRTRSAARATLGDPQEVAR